MLFATISADIVSSSSLTRESMIILNESLRKCIEVLETRYSGLWGRIVRGDSIELVMEHPEDALEVALILKTWVKAYGPKTKSDQSKVFEKYGLRLAIGIGEMKTVDRNLDMMDGDAIYRSGRSLDKLKGWSKYSMTISMADEARESSIEVMLLLVNQLLNGATARKCETLCQRILSGDAQAAATRMGITVSGLNQTMNVVGWTAIEQMLIYYRKTISEIC